MKIATLVSLKAFEAAIVGGSEARASFENSSRGIARFQSWALRSYRRGSDVELLLWEAELGVGDTPFGEQAPAGQVTFRSLLPWRSVNGLVSVDYVGHHSSVEYCRRFGFDRPELAAVIRRARGEYPSLNPSA